MATRRKTANKWGWNRRPDEPKGVPQLVEARFALNGGGEGFAAAFEKARGQVPPQFRLEMDDIARLFTKHDFIAAARRIDYLVRDIRLAKRGGKGMGTKNNANIAQLVKQLRYSIEMPDGYANIRTIESIMRILDAAQDGGTILAEAQNEARNWHREVSRYSTGGDNVDVPKSRQMS